MARHSHLQTHSRLRLALTRLLIGVLLALSGYLAFEFGRIQADFSILEAARERAGFENRIAELDAHIGELNQEIALLETHAAIDREAYEGVEANLVDLQAKIQEQSDAIAFYRGIVSPADGNSGLRVQDFKLLRAKDERSYKVQLVLVQTLQHDRKVSGEIWLTLEGTQGGVETVYPYAELAPEDAGEWSFSFRYFQGFDREIALPDGFAPDRVRLEVRSRTRSISGIEVSYPWIDSLS